MLIVVVISGCSLLEKSAEMEGYILEVETDHILFTENTSQEEYNKIKDLSFEELTSLKPGPSLVYLTYDKTSDLHKGDKVAVTISGDIQASYPGEAKARNIKVIE